MRSLVVAEREGNNFGFLRLFFAGMVIYSHSSQLIYHGFSHDFLRNIFNTLPSGITAVNGFFLISGYLIVKSYEGSRNIQDYLKKRILRIHPGYIMSYVICLLCVVPLMGASVKDLPTLKSILSAILLKVPPNVPGSDIELNASMWTIAFEFRCYLMVAIIGVMGFVKDRKKFLALTLLLIDIVFLSEIFSPESSYTVMGRICQNIRFMAIFCSGGCYYLFRDKIPYNGILALLATILLSILYFDLELVYQATMVFGGYLVFWCAFNIKSRLLNSIGARTDISYGLYLYGWPVQILLLHYQPGLSMWQLFLISLPGAALMGYISWICVEGPFLRLKTR